MGFASSLVHYTDSDLDSTGATNVAKIGFRFGKILYKQPVAKEYFY